jgi:hypothetical protein
MSTHPVEPEPLPPDAEPPVENPSHLPVEPEFPPPLPPSAADDPHPAKPKI